MTGEQVTPEEEYEFYSNPKNREPEGPSWRRKRSNKHGLLPDPVTRVTDAESSTREGEQ